MAQKYRIYINEKVLLLTSTTPNAAKGYQQIDSQGFDLKSIYSQINNQHQQQRFFILTEDAKAALKKLKKSVNLIEAAGGLVKNTEGKYLFIYRNDKWDIPKGKLEKGEGKKEGAVREVEEECGITVSKLGKKIMNTYHVYDHKTGLVLKKTYWYNMGYKGTEKLKPQLEEGITEVRWFSANEVDEIKDNTFPSILDVLEKKRLTKDMPEPL
ncbi:NUDIX hydrolase [Mucilaginibacter myungsuensis]|uniref:NUDIX domain-containing protein n=1 Tax=Mucilaginibacter myungsuensis TaxID=649104 RepID=A0A929L5V5_9SPHI|nr:NUDIX domain-containing protein [Mucilaginibacter myungsuensis]MBE9663766.1 NUDIX domain-containing protein [Mucilaginibacter myungsuensis]MDN3598908.1 NUDIX domain-containing protein [Mucilaginibacter myungsuensis]